MAKKPAKPQHYAARAGKTVCTVYLDPADHETLRKAADLDGRSLTEFLKRNGLAAARKILSKNLSES